MDWMTLAKDFQTVIVGAIGFLGVIATQRMIAKHAIQRDEIALAAKRRAVTAAVRAELTFFRNTLMARASEMEAAAPSAGKVNKLSRKATVDIIGDIGLVNSSSLETVLFALRTLDELYTNLSVIAETETDRFLLFRSEQMPRVAKVFNRVSEDLDKALDTLGDDLT